MVKYAVFSRIIQKYICKLFLDKETIIYYILGGLFANFLGLFAVLLGLSASFCVFPSLFASFCVFPGLFASFRVFPVFRYPGFYAVLKGDKSFSGFCDLAWRHVLSIA